MYKFDHWAKDERADKDLSGYSTATVTYEFEKSDEGKEIKATAVFVPVTGSNDPPIADVGADQTVTEGDKVTLDGSGSSDPDDGIKTYTWTQTGGTPTVDLIGADTAKPTFTAPSVDKSTTLTFQLRVEDNGGLFNTDEVAVTINDNGQGDSGDNGGGGGCFISSLPE